MNIKGCLPVFLTNKLTVGFQTYKKLKMMTNRLEIKRITLGHSLYSSLPCL
ncbi:hypothetical protein SAMN04487765_3732 [Tenacibaculum sp. MAR_2010_89]|nr:hypothetical protein SAMN04487765_3732 [Tenacibaculum sp. MAR_2010_89]